MKAEVDSLALLEERIENLLGHLEKVARANEELRRRNAALEPLATEAAGLREENEKLARQIDKLETEVLASAEKEDQVRERLQSIVRRLDTMDDVLAGQAAAE